MELWRPCDARVAPLVGCHRPTRREFIISGSGACPAETGGTEPGGQQMAVTDQAVDQAYSEGGEAQGRGKADYYGALYLEEEFRIPRDRALNQVGVGANDYGVDGFHFDRDLRNLYLFLFSQSESHGPFKTQLPALITSGMEQVFGASGEQNRDPLLQEIRSCLFENEAIIDKVFVRLVFNGDPEEAQRSVVLEKLQEDLGSKKHQVDQRFRRPVALAIEISSARTHKTRGIRTAGTHTYPVSLVETVTRAGPRGELMTVGFMRLTDLHAMYKEMGQRFFSRNIRSGLSEEEAVNRSIQQSLQDAVLEGRTDPSCFAFNHNGVTLAADAVRVVDGVTTITEPRLLNGAQTVTTFGRFLKAHEGNGTLEAHKDALEKISVMSRIITGATDEFITTVTINNNRQNPVDPASLHANDMIQLELQDRFRGLGIYYERQQRAFDNLSDVDLEDLKIDDDKPVELIRLAKTFIVSDGQIDRLNSFRDVFEDEAIYNQVFSRARINVDPRRVLLCYKVQFRLRRLVNDIVACGVAKYAQLPKASNLVWALLCQGILNDKEVDSHASTYGERLTLEAPFIEWLSGLATKSCRFILSDLLDDKQFADKAGAGSFNFMRTNAAYRRAMELASKRYGWVEKTLA
jgi:hypothetical protein